MLYIMFGKAGSEILFFPVLIVVQPAFLGRILASVLYRYMVSLGRMLYCLLKVLVWCCSFG